MKIYQLRWRRTDRVHRMGCELENSVKDKGTALEENIA